MVQNGRESSIPDKKDVLETRTTAISWYAHQAFGPCLHFSPKGSLINESSHDLVTEMTVGPDIDIVLKNQAL
jgi:hypothetical protein